MINGDIIAENWGEVEQSSLFCQLSHMPLLSLIFVQHTIFLLPFLRPASLCQRVHVNITQNILLQDKNTKKYQLCYLLHDFSVSSKIHVLCEYKQKYILLLSFVIIEVKICTCVNE
jgi:hypothetical protein